jgi:uncharacterized membrane protein
LVINPVSFADLLNSAFNQLRQHSTKSVAVTIRLLEAYTRIAESTDNPKYWKELAKHAKMLKASADSHFEEAHDRQDLETRYTELKEKMQSAWEAMSDVDQEHEE